MDSVGVVLWFFREQPLLAAVLLLVFELPRYGFSALAMLVASFRSHRHRSVQLPAITAIIPVHNGAAGLRATVDSLRPPAQGITEILIVDDGSTDGTAAIAAALAREDPRIRVLTHPLRSGKSAAINHAATRATGILLLTVDVDTVAAPGSVPALAAAFRNPAVAVASGNVTIRNAARNPLTALQSLEYLQSIALGRGFLDHLGSVGCCSGAFSMFRRAPFLAAGGLNVGPGEDLEITLRLREAGHRTRFIGSAMAATLAPTTLPRLIRQRLRWDRDALAIRLFAYRQILPFRRGESLGSTLERLDFLLFDLAATLVFPFYILHVALRFGEAFTPLMAGVLLLLSGIATANLLLVHLALRRLPTLPELAVIPAFALYQGIVLRFLRFFAFSDELLFAGSHRDAFVPPRIRRALYGRDGT